MIHSYLVQRLEKPSTGDESSPVGALLTYGLTATGLSKEARDALKSVCRFDYMGSAEYEFGSVPKAFCEMGKAAKTLIAFEETVHYFYDDWFNKKKIEGDTTLYIICQEADDSEVIESIKEFAIGKGGTKEAVGLNSSLAGTRYAKNIVGWLDLDNGFMFFSDKIMFEKFVALFGIGGIK